MCLIITVTVLSGAILTKPVASTVSTPAERITAAAPEPCARASNPTTSPTPRPPLTRRKSRREIGLRTMRLRMCISGLQVFGGLVDGRADTHVGRAAADVARHGAIDVRVGWLRNLVKERSGGHDLPRLAVAALRYVQVDPSPFHRLARGRRQ